MDGVSKHQAQSNISWGKSLIVLRDSEETGLYKFSLGQFRLSTTIKIPENPVPHLHGMSYNVCGEHNLLYHMAKMFTTIVMMSGARGHHGSIRNKCFRTLYRFCLLRTNAVLTMQKQKSVFAAKRVKISTISCTMIV